MAAIEINWQPSRQDLRSFGFIALGAFGLLGGVVLWRGGLLGFDFGAAAGTVAAALWTLGGISALLSLVAPGANRALYLALVVATYPIGFVLSYVLMGLLFFGIISPVGLVMRVIRFDPLNRGYDSEKQSYWTDHKPVESDERYFRQY